jgi:hypothetical protein
LHSKRFPSELAANPLPVTFTLCMLTRPLFGLTATEAADFFGADVEVVEVTLFEELLEHAPSPRAAKTTTATVAPIFAPKFILGPSRRLPLLFYYAPVPRPVLHLGQGGNGPALLESVRPTRGVLEARTRGSSI